MTSKQDFINSTKRLTETNEPIIWNKLYTVY